MDTISSVILRETGKQVVSLKDITDTWLQWYKGDVADFHTYDAYNGRKKVKQHRKTLNMAKKVCEDWANLLLNEKTDVTYGDEEGQAHLEDVLDNVSFWQKGNEGIEKTFALGKGAFVEGYDADGNERLQFINGKKIYPITFDQDTITECAFVNVSSATTTIQIHVKNNDGNYVIITLVYKKTQNDAVESIGDLVSREVLDTESDIPWFQILKPNVANNVDINSPLGVSVFANSIDALAGVDLAYDGFCEEMRLGKAKIFADSRIMQFDGDEQVAVFDKNDTGIYWYGNGENENKEPLKFYSETLRTDAFFSGINNALNLLSSKVGFGENHYRFDRGGISTATQVVSENSEMFRTLRKHEILLRDVILGVCKALMYIHNTFTGHEYVFDLDVPMEVKFDDSIIEDKETQKLNDRQDVQLGVMSKAEYRAKWYNEDLDTAKANVEAIAEANRANIGSFFSEE